MTVKLGPLYLRGHYYYCTAVGGLIVIELPEVQCLLDLASDIEPPSIDLCAGTHRPSTLAIQVQRSVRGGLRWRRDGGRWSEYYRPYPPVLLALNELNERDFFAWVE